MNKKIIAAAAVAGAVISLIAGLSGNAGTGGLFGKSIVSALLWAAVAFGIAMLLRKTVPEIENVLSETTAESESFPGKGSMLDISDSEIPENNNFSDNVNQEMKDNKTEDDYSESDVSSSFHENNSPAPNSYTENTSAAADKGKSSFTISRNENNTDSDFSDLEDRFSSGSAAAAGTDNSASSDKATSENATASPYSTSAQSRPRGDTSKIEEEFKKQDPQILAKMVRSELKK